MPGPVRRLLVVVDEACTAPSLCASVRMHAEGEPLEVFVVSPAHEAAAPQWYADEDAARADATRRLRTCVGCLQRHGVDAVGVLSGPDPMQAIADALQVFPADRILIVTAPQRPSTWLQSDVIDVARRTFSQPIAHLVVRATSEGERDEAVSPGS